MFEFSNGKSNDTKCYVTNGSLGHLDPKQPPAKRKPFASILAISFIHKIELILPDELYEIIKEELNAKLKTPKYSRVILPLKALLEGEFFNEYIKKGNILMLSEGINGDSNAYFLKDGILTLALERESYERSGLVGEPCGPKAAGGIRPRWSVTMNLRHPSMVHGKRGFDRVVHAFKNVLTEPVTWLFADLGARELSSGPIQEHFPIINECSVKFSPGPSVDMPTLQPPSSCEYEDREHFFGFSVDLYEWFSLISLQSPRLEIEDNIDPFLSRYTPPQGEQANLQAGHLVKLTWKGFISASWACDAFVKIQLAAASSRKWFSFVCCGFGDGPAGDSRDVTVLKVPGTLNDYVLWEIS